MSQYLRIVIKYRLPNSEEWSDLHWCDITKTGEEIQVRIAPVNLALGMPEDAAFIILDPELAKKLLVIDCAGQDIAYYCLICQDSKLFRFDFSQYKVFNLIGFAWLNENEFDSSDKLALQNVFKGEKDARLAMRTKELYHYDLLQNVSVDLARLKQYYQNWQIKLTENIPEKEGIQDVQTVPPQTWKEHKQQPILIEQEDVSAALETINRILIHDKVCAALAQIKRNTASQEQYQQVLYGLLNRKLEPTLSNSDSELALNCALKHFRDIYLRHSDDLKDIYACELSTNPSLYEICEYVYEMVFLELQKWDTALIGQTSDNHKTPIAQSYLQIYVGRAGSSASEAPSEVQTHSDDEVLALNLQMEEFADAGSQSVHPDGVTQASTQTSSSNTSHVPHFPLRRNGLFSGQEASARQGRRPNHGERAERVLLMIAGIALSSYGCYLAFSAPATGIVLILAGILCYIAAMSPSSENRQTPPSTPTGSNYWGYGRR